MRAMDTEDLTPLTTIVGFLEITSRKDAIAYVKGFIERRFEALDESYYQISKFQNGYLWEAQEGGSGKSFLPSIMKIFEGDPTAKVWVPSGSRLFEVIMRDNKPLGLMLPNEQAEIARRDGVPAVAQGKMVKLRQKGILTFGIGAVVFLAGAVMCGAGAVESGLTTVQVATTAPMPIKSMPHRHWDDATKAAKNGGYVSKLEMLHGVWHAVVTHPTYPGQEAEKTPPAISVTVQPQGR